MFEASGVQEQVAQAAALLGPLASAQLWRLSDDEVETALVSLFRAEAALAAARAGLLVEAENRSLRTRTQALSMARWLTQRMRVSRARGERLVRQADLVTSEPLLHEALATGRVSPEQAVVVGTVLAGLPPVADHIRAKALGLLLEQCAALDPTALARAGRHLHEQLTSAPDSDDPAEQARLEAAAVEHAETALRRRALTWQRHGDGSISGRFRLDPLGGQLFLTAITALSYTPDPQSAAARVTGVDGQPLDPAEACGLIDPATIDSRTGPQRRADALVTLAERAARAGQLPDRAGQTTTLLVTTTLEALEGRTAAAGLLPYGGTLDPTTLRMLACDTAVIPAVLGGAGQVLDLGRTRRLFTAAQRRAITARDRGCIHPGCDAAPIDCDTHHAVPWYLGGTTDLANGHLLCRYDHQRHHREGWTIGRDHRGYPYVVPPPTIDPHQTPRQHIRYQTERLRT